MVYLCYHSKKSDIKNSRIHRLQPRWEAYFRYCTPSHLSDEHRVTTVGKGYAIALVLLMMGLIRGDNHANVEIDHRAGD